MSLEGEGGSLGQSRAQQYSSSRKPSFRGPDRRDRRDRQWLWLDGRPEDPFQVGASQIVDCVKERRSPHPTTTEIKLPATSARMQTRDQVSLDFKEIK